jgi:hypothetical protein
MPLNVDKTRRTCTLWTETADLLRALSYRLNRSQVELLHEAVVDLEHKIMADERRAAWKKEP